METISILVYKSLERITYLLNDANFAQASKELELLLADCIPLNKRELPKSHGLSTKRSMSRTDSIYAIWVSMKRRCLNKNDRSYNNYGGRGIKVCDRWIESVVNFFEDMGPRPGKEYSLDRIDVNGNYCPENCRWATRKEQAGNTRMTRKVTYQGNTKCLRDWAKKTGISEKTLANRLNAGWSIEDTLFTKPRRNLVTYQGITKPLCEWAKDYSIPRSVLSERLRKSHWSIEKALTTPVESYRAQDTRFSIPITYQGITKPLFAWAEELGFGNWVLLYRLEKDWTPEEILTTPLNAGHHKQFNRKE